MPDQRNQVGDYLLEAEVNQDDWFTYYTGYHLDDDQPLQVMVVQKMFADDPFFVQRFKHIRQRVAELEHPNIIPSDLAVEAEGYLLTTQATVLGRTLAQVIAEEGVFSLQRMQFVVGQLALALDYAHHHGVKHGNLSAEQIYLDDQDNVTVVGFGTTQILFGTDVSQHSYALITPETLSPERARGEGPSCQADLYSLGVLAYQMLAKAPPFTGAASKVMHAQAYKQPKPLHSINTGVSIPLSETISRMLAKSVDIRYNTGAEFVQAITATYRSNNRFQFDKHLPAYYVERKQLLDRGLVYFSAALIMMLLLMSISIWAGYETALKYALRPAVSVVLGTPTHEPQVKIYRPPTTVVPTPTRDITDQQVIIIEPESTEKSPTNQPDYVANYGLPSPTAPLIMVADVTAPTATTSPTPTPTVIVVPATPTPTATPMTTDGQFTYRNPTGHDLILDLTGPHDMVSQLIVPHSQHVFTLVPGHYQYIVHTTTGKELPTKIGAFNISPNVQTERDYYYAEDRTVQ